VKGVITASSFGIDSGGKLYCTRTECTGTIGVAVVPAVCHLWIAAIGGAGAIAVLPPGSERHRWWYVSGSDGDTGAVSKRTHSRSTAGCDFWSLYW
jgi:hypothetical protein